MTSHPPTPIFILLFLLSLPHPHHGLGASSTIAAVSSTPTLCGVVAGDSTRRIECFTNGRRVLIQPNITYDSLSGGSAFFCGLRSGGTTLLCWDSDSSPAKKGTFFPKRIYFSNALTLSEISVGHDHICAIANATNRLMCWRGMRGSFPFPILPDLGFRSISSGLGFSCGVLISDSDGFGNVRCWGSNSSLAAAIQAQFGNISVSRVFAGAQHLCGFKSKSNSSSSDNDSLICKGSNAYGQLDSPIGESFTNLALGFDFTCGILESNRTVTCWGGGGRYNSDSTRSVSFELITGGLDFVCGLSSANFSVICWGPGWPGEALPDLPLSAILPGRCVQSSCQCGTYPESEKLCSGSGLICNRCDSLSLSSPDPPPSSPLLVSSSPPLLASSSFSVSKPPREELMAFVIVGSVGGLAGICSIVYCLYMGVCCGRKKVHNSVQPQITRAGSNADRFSSNSPPSLSSTFRRQCSRALGRQRSGTSSTKHLDRAEEFTFSELAAATDNFSLGNKIGAGSFGVVYRGKLLDGRDVAIKRGETSPKAKKFQEKESAFESELSFLSRLHHKHLVRLVGFCQERDERLLVYEYMKNGALYDHLHDKKNVEKGCSVVNSWKIRIKVALDAARGIEYLHNYAVPPIIHRDIKSSNILLDLNWTARVSDFGLSLMGPEANRDFRPSKAAGTVGYIDPEYYSLNVLTAKSDVYGLGVVLLELLTGKRAIFKADKDGGAPTSVVDYAVEAIIRGELGRILDPRVGPPAMNELDAVELVAYTAMHCVNLEGKDRPTMSDIVANLERALALCDVSHGSISSASMSAGSG